jgi:hypothetical protein
MTYDRYHGHRYAGARLARDHERHFGGGSPKPPAPPPPPPPPPSETDPEVEKQKRQARQDIRQRRGRRATVLTGGELPEPATQRGSLTVPGSLTKLGGA